MLYFSTACFGTHNSFHAFAKHIKQSLLALYPTHYILAAFVVRNQVGELFVLRFSTARFDKLFWLDINTSSFRAFAKHIK